jgi:ferredoxin, 2Fe-2S
LHDSNAADPSRRNSAGYGMPQIKFIAFDGTEQTIEIKEGETVMFGATRNGVDGIVGECGGFCNCATCHVYIAEPWLSQLPPQSEQEDEMLEGTVSDRKPGSRLGCQITITDALDGMVVHTPERQSL